jgi:hypothetical protein
MDAAERSMYNALKELQKMRKGKEEEEPEEALPELGSIGEEREAARVIDRPGICPTSETGSVLLGARSKERGRIRGRAGLLRIDNFKLLF